MRKIPSSDEITLMVAKINASEDIESLLNTIIDKIKDALFCQGCSILLYSEEYDCLEFFVSSGDKSENLKSLKVPRGKGIAGYVMESKTAEVVNSAQNDPRLFKNIDQTIGFQTRNVMANPMIAHNEFIGVIEVVNTLDERDFNDFDLSLFRSLSEVAAIAIHNRNLIDALSGKLREVNTLFRVTNSLSSISETGEFFEKTCQFVAEIFEAERVSLFLRNEDEWNATIPFQGSPPPQELERSFVLSPILLRILETKEAILVENTSRQVDLEFRYTNNYKTKSFISLPLLIDSEIIGVLNVSERISRKIFSKLDLQLLKILINHVLEIYKSMIDREDREKYQLLQRDLFLARKIQRYSLPNIPQQINGIHLDFSYHTCTEIGGDFYDLLYHNSDIFTVLIADVSGKGIPAALFMEYSKTVLSGEITKFENPSSCLKKSHTLLQNKPDLFMHVEVMIIQIDTARKSFTYSSAGHNRQVYYNSSNKKIELLRTRGIPLGSSLPFLEFTENKVNYNPGDIILLYTDGITELRSPSGEMYGEERLFSILLNHPEKPISELKKMILESMDAFRKQNDFNDDFTLILIGF
ncbi:MAG: SpoIIE family protein phosphatase [Leptospiraceae bacterium]|nr:SpoIIE family protein phosphatase [Leptospiraceae bacterium]MCP5511399.1 SpoIIE family protein phosphatase [Leptospiraceae bacterium]